MSATVTAVLLDTCAVIWLANRDPLHRDAVARFVQAGLVNGILAYAAAGHAEVIAC